MYNMVIREIKLLFDDLYLVNGVVLLLDEFMLFIVEMSVC